MTHVAFTVNGVNEERDIEPRCSLLDTLRDHLGLTGTHAGCEHGACGACTVLVDGRSVRSCLMLGVQADGAEITTIEGIAGDGPLHPIQRAFADHHGLQCGFCTPGMVLAACELLGQNPHPTDKEITDAMSGNLCRCTGYAGIVAAIRAAGGEARA